MQILPWHDTHPDDKMRDITELPHDLFLIIISYLPPKTCIRSRCVSRRWYTAFTDDSICLLLLRWNFPRCREMRLAAATALMVSSPSAPQPAAAAAFPTNLRAEVQQLARAPRIWSATFAEVAQRYCRLDQAEPRVVEKLEMAANDVTGGSLSFWGVAPWNRYLRLNEKTANFHYPDPGWSYSQEDGVLVYPAEVALKDLSFPDEFDGHVFHVVDLSTGVRVPVPFDVRAKHIRRLRLAQGVLIFEWAEALPYHQLNAREVVHRHFVTAFDVVRRFSPTSNDLTWTVEFRCEFKLHFLGLPLNRSDRFFSAHTATHYAVYFWQPNRSLYQDDPIEQLAVWDISSPSPYRPSQDPKGGKRTTVERQPSLPTGLWSGKGRTTVISDSGTAGSSSDLETPTRRPSLAQATAGPQVIRRMAWRELDFYGLRQRATPQLRSLALDERNLYIVEEEHRWADGQHSSLNPPRVHLVKCTGIPVIPPQAPMIQESKSTATKSTSDLTSGTGQAADSATRSSVLSAILDGPVHGPVWLDACGADGDHNMSFCRRVADANGITGVDPSATVWPPPTMASRNIANQDSLVAQLRSRPSASANGWPWVVSKDKNPKDIVTNMQPSRWSGWAPCWRHEDFPYLTVAEMVDFAAGVRVTARHCFMLETLSVHVRPAVSVVQGIPSAVLDGVRGNSQPTLSKRQDGVEKSTSGRCQEVEFADNMWSELVAKGHLAGDERWVIGEDEKGRITIVRF
ncbi:hypothetical protein QBC35DRAFT_481229 [Podospora australis]|uniref:F-box domain-containing protein n=1 Tax=Podospora australis TaxID=1536484 RepID=A0AAN6X3H4_9PEZI|nr:hypothetical protein QBC35DRAFT_481229 [Podospora australis]